MNTLEHINMSKINSKKTTRLKDQDDVNSKYLKQKASGGLALAGRKDKNLSGQELFLRAMIAKWM